MDLVGIHKLVVTIAEKASEIAMKDFRSVSSYSKKGIGTYNESLVLDIDKRINEFLIYELGGIEPSIGFIAEESDIHNIKEYNWIIDPIDGTSTYLNGHEFWGISISLWRENKPLYGLLYFPTSQDRYYYSIKGVGAYDHEGRKLSIAEKLHPKRFIVTAGIIENTKKVDLYDWIINKQSASTYHLRSACYDGKLMISGGIDLLIYSKIAIWDIAAVMAITKELGYDIHYLIKPFDYKHESFADYTHYLMIGSTDIINECKDEVKNILDI